MERGNYNRAGNHGGNRGGRSNSGRSSGGPQSGGRGGNGRGSVDGYSHGSGGNRNYQQQHSNQHQVQHQEQYGGGRGRGGGRESGGNGNGRGRGQQNQWTPANPRQNADRVPDRSDGGREGNTWSRIATGQPVVPPNTQTLIQNRTDHQVQEVQHLEAQFVSSVNVKDHSQSKGVVATGSGYLPIKRPDRGTLGTKTVKLLVNHFPVTFDPSTSILRYDVDIKHAHEQESSSSSSTRALKKPIPKACLRQIQEKLCSDHPNQFPLLQTAYDGEKLIFSAVLLQQGTYTVSLSGRTYTCTIKHETRLNLSKLQDFPREIMQALDVVMKANLYREKVSVGRGFYSRVYKPEDDLRCGVAAYRGSQQSLKVTSNGLVMCTDYTVVPFRKHMPVLEFLKESLWEVKTVDDILKVRNKVMMALKGLKVSVTHRRTKQKYTVAGLSEKATKDISFELEDLEGKKKPEVVKLIDYFRDKWGKEIEHKRIPCLNLGNGKKPNYVPMEFCILVEDRRFPKEQLGKDAARKLKELSLLAPNFRMGEICDMVQDEFATGSHGAEVIQNFGLGVDLNMTEVNGRVLEPPTLRLGGSNGKTNITVVDKQKCHYNFLSGKTFIAGKAVNRWALIDFCGGHRNWFDADSFIPKLIARCNRIGVKMEEPLWVCPTDMRDLSTPDNVRGLLNWIVGECKKIDTGRLEMIICVMPEIHFGYKYIKSVGDKEIGVITQCCLSTNTSKANDQFLANLSMKINAKLDGSNVELADRFPFFKKEDRYMFIGADVNHPAASNKSSPSVAAVVGSVNWPAATRYAARVVPQAHRKEEIVNFGSLCLDLINTYEKVNGVKPNKIVVFRDGVSFDQFEMVLNKEMVDLKKAIYTDKYRPFVTFVVAQKRHTTRLFLDNGREIGNMQPGTVVDTHIVHPSNFDFYLCSHFGGIGTSKATHYTVIWDENGFTSNSIQKLSYDLCFIFARCSKPVSLVTPVYYADLAAYRGRMFQEVVMEGEASGSQSGSSSSGSRSGYGSGSGSGLGSASFDPSFYALEPHLKDSMFFI